MTRGSRKRLWSRRTFHAALASGLALVGLTAFATPAFAHANIITGTVSCASAPGTGFTITWTVANDFNLSEVAEVSAATGGIATVNPISFRIGPSGNGSGGYGTLPYTSVELAQTLPPTASGTISLTVSSTFSDDYQTSNSGDVTLPSSCSPSHPASLPTLPIATTPVPVIPPPPPAPQPGIAIHKTERVGATGAFVHGPVKAVLGEQLQYQILVTNTGNTSLNVVLTDPHCDAGTLTPAGTQTIAVGSSLTYTCSHVLLVVPNKRRYQNVATAIATSPQGTKVGPVTSKVLASILVPKLRVKVLAPAKSAKPVLKEASFTG